MKTLTIYQPHALKIVLGLKWIENRTRMTNYRGPLAIHASVNREHVPVELAPRMTFGAVIGTVDLVACLSLAYIEQQAKANKHRKPHHCQFTFGEIAKHKYKLGPVCWILQNPRMLARPVPARGQQYLFDVPDDLIAESGFLSDHEVADVVKDLKL